MLYGPVVAPQPPFLEGLLARDSEAIDIARQTLTRWERGHFIGVRETRAAAVRRLEREAAGRYPAKGRV